MDLNKVMLIGRLTKNPEMRSIPSGQQVTSFSLATNRYFKDSAGQKQEKSEFHTIVAWGKLAEICAQYLAKGRRAYVEGRLQTRDWVGQDGVRRYSTEVLAENMIILDSPSSSSTREPFSPQNKPQEKAVQHNGQQEEMTEEEHTLEEIPF
ncbi:MAG: single-stranded DNA-binding protein [bacterium]|nr:single-stranded DNA-binding protein [bacterium]